MDFRKLNAVSQFDTYPRNWKSQIHLHIGPLQGLRAGSIGEEVQGVHHLQDTYGPIPVNNYDIWT